MARRILRGILPGDRHSRDPSVSSLTLNSIATQSVANTNRARSIPMNVNTSFTAPITERSIPREVSHRANAVSGPHRVRYQTTPLPPDNEKWMRHTLQTIIIMVEELKQLLDVRTIENSSLAHIILDELMKRLEDYYTKAEVDALIEMFVKPRSKKVSDLIWDLNDGTGYVLREGESGEVEVKIGDELIATWTEVVKEMIDALANAEDVYVKDEVYTKDEVDAKVESIEVDDTVAPVSRINWEGGSELKESGTVTIGGDDVIVSSAMNAKVDALANVEDVYVKDEVYTKDEVDAKVETLRTTVKDEARKVSRLQWDGNELRNGGTVMIGGDDVIVSSTMNAKVDALANAEDVYVKGEVDSKVENAPPPLVDVSKLEWNVDVLRGDGVVTIGDGDVGTLYVGYAVDVGDTKYGVIQVGTTLTGTGMGMLNIGTSTGEGVSETGTLNVGVSDKGNGNGAMVVGTSEGAVSVGAVTLGALDGTNAIFVNGKKALVDGDSSTVGMLMWDTEVLNGKVVVDGETVVGRVEDDADVVERVRMGEDGVTAERGESSWGMFVAVGAIDDELGMATSKDGAEWELVGVEGKAVDGSRKWTSTCWGRNGEGEWVMMCVTDVGDDWRCVTTKDGRVWTTQPGLMTTAGWQSVTWGNGVWVAVASSGDGKRSAWSVDGETWEWGDVDASESWWSVTWGDGRFVAVAANGGSGKRAAWSVDGKRWHEGGLGTSSWQSVTWSGGRFVAVAYGGDVRAAWSEDGEVWHDGVIGDGAGWVSVSGNGKRLVAVGVSSGMEYCCAVSDDGGETWEKAEGLSVKNNWIGVTWGDGRWVAVASSGGSGHQCAWSVNGKDWNAGGLERKLWYTIGYAPMGEKRWGRAKVSGEGVTVEVDGDVRVRMSKEGLDVKGTMESDGRKVVRGALWAAVANSGDNHRCATSTDGVEWVPHEGLGVESEWRAVCYGKETFVAVAASGDDYRCMTSKDCVTWLPSRSLSTKCAWTSVCYGGGVFVAVSDGGEQRCATSEDGAGWTMRDGLSANNRWTSVCYGNGVFVAVSDMGFDPRCATSKDGKEWEPQTGLYMGNSWASVCYGDGMFVAVAYGGGGPRCATSWDGVTWIERDELSSVNGWMSVCYGGGLWVAVASGGSGARCATSTDGVKWVQQEGLSMRNAWQSVSYGDGVFFAMAWDGEDPRCATSRDGVEWDGQVGLDAGSGWMSVCYAPPVYDDNVIVMDAMEGKWRMPDDSIIVMDGKEGMIRFGDEDNAVMVMEQLFVAVAYSGSDHRCATSTDGVTWTPQSSLYTMCRWQSICYGNGTFVAVASSGSDHRCATSTDGVTWTPQRSLSTGNSWQSVCYGNGTFVAVANNGNDHRCATSTDGVTWTPQRSLGMSTEWYSVCYGNGTFVTVARSSSDHCCATSTDGVTWTPQTSLSTGNYWYSVCYGNGTFVAVARSSSDHCCATSTDGVTWTPQTSLSTGNQWRSVCYGNGTFVAVADSGNDHRCATSTDGVTWTPQTSLSTGNEWRSVCYGSIPHIPSSGLSLYTDSTGTAHIYANGTDILASTLSSRSISPSPSTPSPSPQLITTPFTSTSTLTDFISASTISPTLSISTSPTSTPVLTASTSTSALTLTPSSTSTSLALASTTPLTTTWTSLLSAPLSAPTPTTILSAPLSSTSSTPSPGDLLYLIPSDLTLTTTSTFPFIGVATSISTSTTPPTITFAVSGQYTVNVPSSSAFHINDHVLTDFTTISPNTPLTSELHSRLLGEVISIPSPTAITVRKA